MYIVCVGCVLWGGGHSAQSTPLELLTDVLERYILQLGKVTHRYPEQCMYIVCVGWVGGGVSHGLVYSPGTADRRAGMLHSLTVDRTVPKIPRKRQISLQGDGAREHQ